jgi:hypothetical protein
MQNTPDHLSLLHMYKRAGVEPIKVAKSVIPYLSSRDFQINIHYSENEA